MEEYDQYGRQTRWRQYEYSDSTKYDDRIFTYKIHDTAQRSNKSLLDSVGIDKNGFVNYRMLYDTYTEIELEALLENKIMSKRQPIKVFLLDKHKKAQAYIAYFYNDKNYVEEKRFCFPNDSIIEKMLYTYHINGMVKEIKKMKSDHVLSEIKLFNNAGLLQEEIHYSEEVDNEVSYKVVRSYNNQGYEIENITYSMTIQVLRPSRKEISEYQNGSCLKSKSIIYSIDQFSAQETMYTVVKYTYEYFIK